MTSQLTPQWARISQDQPDLHLVFQRLAKAMYEQKAAAVPVSDLEHPPNDSRFEHVEGDLLTFRDPALAEEYFARLVLPELDGSWENVEKFERTYAEALHRAVRCNLRTRFGSTLLLLLARECDRDMLARMSEMAALALENDAWKRRFWTLHHSFCEVLPQLNTSASDLVQYLDPILRAESGDLAAGGPYRAIRRIAEQSSAAAQDLVATLLASTTDSVASLASDALLGLATHDFASAHRQAIELTSSERWIHRRVGVAALGRLPYPDEQTCRETLDHLLELAPIRSGTEDVLVRTYGDLLKLAPVPARKRLTELARSTDEATRYQLSFVLFLCADEEVDEPWFGEALLGLSGTDPSNRSILNHLDSCLEKLAQRNPRVACQFLERFADLHPELPGADRHSQLSSSFSETLTALYVHQRSSLERLVTGWFLATDRARQKHAASIVDHFHQIETDKSAPVLNLDTTVLSRLSTQEVIDALSHVLGFVHGGKPLAELLLSALWIEPLPDELARFVTGALASYVLYNYPQSARAAIDAWLVQANKDAPEAEVAREALAHLESYERQRKDLPEAKEFRPASWRRQRFGRVVLRHQSQAVQKAVESESLLLQLMTRVSVKYGRSMFSEHGGQLTEPVHMAPITHSVELPRGEFVDPIGQAYRRYVWQQAGGTHKSDPPTDKSGRRE